MGNPREEIVGWFPKFVSMSIDILISGLLALVPCEWYLQLNNRSLLYVLIQKTQVDIVRQGVETWNSWRIANRSIKPDLPNQDLSEMDLNKVDLSEADLSNTDFFGSKLNAANLKMAVLSDADFSDAQMRGAELYKANLSSASLLKTDLSQADLGAVNLQNADLRGANLSGANLEEADLSGADLREANLSGANLGKAILVGSKLQFADFSDTNTIALKYLPYSSMRGHYHGLRGLDSCFGNALFVRDARDQDYIDTLEISIDQTEAAFLKKIKQATFSIWEWIDFGRSLAKATFYGSSIAIFFGVIYLCDMTLEWGLVDYSGSAQSLLTPFYFSVVTFTTLGYGDILPVHWLGEALVIIEVVLGYSTLGLLLSILANKVSRRS